jgi:hypothetical protein
MDMDKGRFSLFLFAGSTLPLSAREGSMLHEGQGNSSRQLIRVEGRSARGWGCSECAWLFSPLGPSVGRSLDEMKRNYQRQLSDEFATHACAAHLRVKVASRFVTLLRPAHPVERINQLDWIRPRRSLTPRTPEVGFLPSHNLQPANGGLDEALFGADHS